MKQTKTPKVFSLGKECPMCGQKAYLRMTEEEENQWRKYACFGGHIQDRFPDMDVQKREFIKSALIVRKHYSVRNMTALILS